MLVEFVVAFGLHLVSLLLARGGDALVGAVELAEAERGSGRRRVGGAGDVVAFAAGLGELAAGIALCADFGAECGGARGCGRAGLVRSSGRARQRVRVTVLLQLRLYA